MRSKAGVWFNAAVLALAGASQCAAPASASQTPAAAEVNRTTVHFSDLNVDHPTGAAVLYQRIRHAAEGVCGERRDPGTQMISRQWRSCVALSVDRAVVSLDRPALTAYHRIQAAHSDRVASAALIASSQ
jgi:UrcA family protein